MNKFYSQFLLWMVGLLLPTISFAQLIDIPVMHGGRTAGMASGGATATSGSSGNVFYNPATIAGIESQQFAIEYTTSLLSTTAPANGADSVVGSDLVFTPLYNVNAAYQLNDAIVLGFSTYTGGGTGASYSAVNLGVAGLPELTSSLLVGDIEMGPVLGIKLPYDLRLGIAYKVSYFFEKLKSSDWSGNYADPTVSGWNFTGLRIGLQYVPCNYFAFGISYRLPQTTEVSGDYDLTAFSAGATTPTTLTATTEIQYESQLRAGTLFSLPEYKMSFGLDLEYIPYSNVASNVLTVAGTPSTTTLNWDDGYAGFIGAEYSGLAKLPLRLGFGYQTQIIPADFASSLFPPPSHALLFSVGAGYMLSGKEINFWYNLLTFDGSVPTGTVTAFSGDYSLFLHAIGLEFQMGS
jgi:long-chain fatty acid transport protein